MADTSGGFSGGIFPFVGPGRFIFIAVILIILLFFFAIIATPRIGF